MITESVLDITSVGFTSATEYAQSLATEVGVTVEIPLPGLHAAFALSETVSTLRSSLQLSAQAYLFLRQFASLYRMRFDMTAALSSTSSSFPQSVMQLPQTYSPACYQQFLQRYGTHVVIEGLFGGTAELSAYVSSDFLVNYGMQAAEFNLKLLFAGRKTGIGASYNKPNSVTSDFTAAIGSSLDFKYQGGTDTLSLQDWSKWVQTVRTNPVLVAYKLAPITAFIADPIRRKLMAQFIAQYLDDNVLIDVPAPPPPVRMAQCNCVQQQWTTGSQSISCPPDSFIAGATTAALDKRNEDHYVAAKNPFCCKLCVDWFSLGTFPAPATASPNIQRPTTVSSQPTSSVCAQPTLGASICGSKYPCFPGIDRVGVGFDVVLGQTIPQQIIQFTYSGATKTLPSQGSQIFAVPDQANIIASGLSSKTNSNIARSQQDVAYFEAQSSGFSAVVPGYFGLSSRAKSSRSTFYGAQSLFSLYEEISYQYQVNLIDPALLMNSTTSSFQRAVAALPVTYDEDAYSAFVQQFGTHVITSGYYGGKAAMSVAVDSSYYVSQSDQEIQNSVKILFLQFKKGKSQTTTTFQFNSQTFAEFQLFGGDYEDLKLDSDAAYDTWIASTECNPAQIVRNGEKIQKFFPPNSPQQQNMDKYIQTYLASNVLPATPIPQKNTFQQTAWQNSKTGTQCKTGFFRPGKFEQDTGKWLEPAMCSNVSIVNAPFASPVRPLPDDPGVIIKASENSKLYQCGNNRFMFALTPDPNSDPIHLMFPATCKDVYYWPQG